MRRSNNPYCGFKDDHERRLALRSRDLRLTIIALVCILGGSLGPQVLRALVWLGF